MCALGGCVIAIYTFSTWFANFNEHCLCPCSLWFPFCNCFTSSSWQNRQHQGHRHGYMNPWIPGTDVIPWTTHFNQFGMCLFFYVRLLSLKLISAMIDCAEARNVGNILGRFKVVSPSASSFPITDFPPYRNSFTFRFNLHLYVSFRCHRMFAQKIA